MYRNRNRGRCPASISCCGAAAGTVSAGEAQSQTCDAWPDGNAGLARIYFPDQDYTEGYCPCEALNNGTLFPELVM